MKRRPISVFSLSFLDCICCGLGAVILLFVIVNAKSAVRQDEMTSNLRSQIDRMEREVLDGKKALIEARNTLEETRAEIIRAQGLSKEVVKVLEEKKIELAHYDRDTIATKTHVNKLKADLRSMEEEQRRLEAGSKAREDHGSKLRPFPGEGDRHYLTDLKMGGKRIFILLDASASMLDETIIGVIRRRHLSTEEKLMSDKWQQAVSTVEWLISQLPPESKYQVYTFNETSEALVEGTKGSWLDAGDVERLDASVEGLRRIFPQKGTSLVNGFHAFSEMTPSPDNIFLLTDGLPTLGEKKTRGKKVSGKKRLNLFNRAVRQLPSGVPVNVILYPMEGDPFAAVAFWRLAAFSKGSFFCPSEDWP